MIERFIATQAATVEEEGCAVTGVRGEDAGPARYLTFMRAVPAGGEEDDGVYFEFDDQLNSGYEKVARCSLERGRLVVGLSEPVDRQRAVMGFEVELRVSDAEWEALAAGLARVFSGRDGVPEVRRGRWEEG